MIIQIHDTNLKDIKTSALIDSGAQGHFVDKSQVDKGKTRRLARPIIIRNVDGTQNIAGKIMHKTRVKYQIGNQDFDKWFLITKLGDQSMILGMPWLRDHNPRIDWQENVIKLIDWEKERGHSLQSITQIIKAIIVPKKETKLNRVLMGSTGICKKGVIDEEDYLVDFLNKEEIKSWIRIKQITKYLEKEEDVQTLGEDCTWVHVKQLASQ